MTIARLDVVRHHQSGNLTTIKLLQYLQATCAQCTNLHSVMQDELQKHICAINSAKAAKALLATVKKYLPSQCKIIHNRVCKV